MNNVPLNLYRIFYYVALYKNISKTAKYLYVSQPSITQAIKRLESILGIQLIVRMKKGIELTSEGEILFNYVKIGIEALLNGEKKIEEVKKNQSKVIKIGASYSITKFFLLPLIEEFRQLYPNDKIQIVNSNTVDLIKLLKTKAIDIMVLNLPQENDEGLNYVKKIEVHDCFVASKKYYYNLVNQTISLHDLNQYPIILKNKNSNTRRFLDLHCATNNVILNPTYEVTSHWLLTDFVGIGYGIGHATYEFVREKIDNGEFFIVDVYPKIKTRYVGFAVLNNMPYTGHLQKFIELLDDFF